MARTSGSRTEEFGGQMDIETVAAAVVEIWGTMIRYGLHTIVDTSVLKG
jgi:hypothetical protein